jgi:hypothetical protein
MRDRKDEKDRASADIAAAIEAERREPDNWERMCLVQAIVHVFAGAYRLALSNAELARTPVDQRSPLCSPPSEPSFDHCSLALLKRALVEAEAEPVRKFPSFGPIEFSGEI